MSLREIERRLGFAGRCAVSGAGAYLLAAGIGLPHPVWASVSSLIVSQESLDATRHSVIGRVIGTIAGAIVAILVCELGHRIGLGTAVIDRPSIRVSLWTCPVVLLTITPGLSVEHAGLMRSCEVIIGAFTGGLLHWSISRATSHRAAVGRSTN